jgi:hypothetical protein
VTSSYYRSDLPDWVKRFNRSGAITRYRGRTWNRLLPRAAYAVVGSDDVPAEENPAGMGRTFPHRLGSRRSPQRDFITTFQTSPFENDVIVDFAIAAVTADSLGRDEDPDLLAIGFSANDLVGHSYGPDSHEVMDITLRTDRQLERLLGLAVVVRDQGQQAIGFPEVLSPNNDALTSIETNSPRTLSSSGIVDNVHVLWSNLAARHVLHLVAFPRISWCDTITSDVLSVLSISFLSESWDRACTHEYPHRTRLRPKQARGSGTWSGDG